MKQNMPKDGPLTGMAVLLALMLPSQQRRRTKKKISKVYSATEKSGCRAAKRRLRQCAGERVFVPPTGRLLVRRGHG